MANESDLKFDAFGLAGSSPAFRITTSKKAKVSEFLLFTFTLPHAGVAKSAYAPVLETGVCGFESHLPHNDKQNQPAKGKP